MNALHEGNGHIYKLIVDIGVYSKWASKYWWYNAWVSFKNLDLPLQYHVQKMYLKNFPQWCNCTVHLVRCSQLKIFNVFSSCLVGWIKFTLEWNNQIIRYIFVYKSSRIKYIHLQNRSVRFQMTFWCMLFAQQWHTIFSCEL